jgi:alkylation response protein AidB-like acyl-CoA dehydrogenase
MNPEFGASEKEKRAEFRSFSDREIFPYADEFDREEKLPLELVHKIATIGYLGSFLPRDWGGSGLDMLTYGFLTEEIGQACSSVRSLLTVHDMVAAAILRWGNQEQRQAWLPLLARGQLLGALAASEPQAGSDLASIETTAVRHGDGYKLTGRKRWVSFGQIADVFLVLARLNEACSAFLVERDRPGLATRPIVGMLGVRASMLAELEFTDCWIPQNNLIGRPGFGFISVLSTALDLGRYSVAWGCVGIAQACLEASVRYAQERKQFGKPLREHQLIQQMVSDMVVNTRAARLLCWRAGVLKNNRDPEELAETLAAKYFASGVAMKSASDAVQIHGANGCSNRYPVERYMRDAKIMEIIEGSNQIQQILISGYAFQEGAGAVARYRTHSSGTEFVHEVSNR